MRLSNEIIEKIEEIIFPDPHMLESEIAIATQGEESSFQARIEVSLGPLAQDQEGSGGAIARKAICAHPQSRSTGEEKVTELA